MMKLFIAIDQYHNPGTDLSTVRIQSLLLSVRIPLRGSIDFLLVPLSSPLATTNLFSISMIVFKNIL
jgi:hypothetical protein